MGLILSPWKHHYSCVWEQAPAGQLLAQISCPSFFISSHEGLLTSSTSGPFTALLTRCSSEPLSLLYGRAQIRASCPKCVTHSTAWATTRYLVTGLGPPPNHIPLTRVHLTGWLLPHCLSPHGHRKRRGSPRQTPLVLPGPICYSLLLCWIPLVSLGFLCPSCSSHSHLPLCSLACKGEDWVKCDQSEGPCPMGAPPAKHMGHWPVPSSSSFSTLRSRSHPSPTMCFD